MSTEPMMTTCYIIYPESRSIIKHTLRRAVFGVEVMNDVVGGAITLGCELPTGDTLYVNDEGLFLFHHFFTVPGGHQPFAGNGIVVGKEVEEGEKWYNADPAITLEDLMARTHFYNRGQAALLPTELTDRRDETI